MGIPGTRPETIIDIDHPTVDLAAAHGITLFDAPVSGSTHPAEECHPTFLGSGPGSDRAVVERILAAWAVEGSSGEGAVYEQRPEAQRPDDALPAPTRTARPATKDRVKTAHLR